MLKILFSFPLVIFLSAITISSEPSTGKKPHYLHSNPPFLHLTNWKREDY
jgi:hypothetical protein